MIPLPDAGHVKTTEGVEVFGPKADEVADAVWSNLLDICEGVTGIDLSEMR